MDATTQAVASVCDKGLVLGATDSEASVTERVEGGEAEEVCGGDEEERTVPEAQAEGSARGGGRKRKAPKKMDL